MPAARRGGLSGWRVARVGGIDLRMHPTFLLLVALVLVGLFGPVLDGLAWLAMVFTSVVLHELGHSLVARRLGLQVRDIVLLPIGGASEIEDLGEDPQREVTVAIVGPITSFVLAAALAAGLTVTGVGVGAPALAGGTFATRAVWLNVALGTFNLLPALPMDGGRVLRGALARRIGFEAATRTAARVGRWLAVVMGAVGFVVMPWLCVIAVFVYAACRVEETRAVVHTKLAGLRVRDVMTPVADPTVRLGSVLVHENDPLEAAVAQIADANDDIGTVVDADEHVRGVLLLRRVAELLRDD